MSPMPQCSAHCPFLTLKMSQDVKRRGRPFCNKIGTELTLMSDPLRMLGWVSSVRFYPLVRRVCTPVVICMFTSDGGANPEGRNTRFNHLKLATGLTRD